MLVDLIALVDGFRQSVEQVGNDQELHDDDHFGEIGGVIELKGHENNAKKHGKYTLSA
jgi:hypothetical protein